MTRDQLDPRPWELLVESNLRNAMRRREAIDEFTVILRRARQAAIQEMIKLGRPVKLGVVPGLELFPPELRLWPV